MQDFYGILVFRSESIINERNANIKKVQEPQNINGLLQVRHLLGHHTKIQRVERIIYNFVYPAK